MGQKYQIRTSAVRFVTSIALLIPFGILHSSCGETQFTGKKIPKPVEAETPKQDDPPEPFSAEAVPETPIEIVAPEPPIVIDPTIDEQSFSLAWEWQCASTPTSLTPKKLELGQVLLKGAGPHQISTTSDFSMNIDIRGQICQPQNLAREIVLVVDVSGSMGGVDGSDPLAVDCGRKTAIKALLDNLKLEKDVKIGLITFDDVVIVNSVTMMKPADFELLHLKDNELCVAGDGTNYVGALAEAQTMLATGLATSKKEVFFLTDGLPNDLNDSANKAAEVRINATIAAVMLGNADDTHLKNSIASKGANNLPLFAKAVDANQLALVLSELVSNEIVSGILRYRAIDSETWQEEDLLEAAEEFEFTVDRLSFDRKDYPKGFEFEFNYLDKFGIATSNLGKITW